MVTDIAVCGHCGAGDLQYDPLDNNPVCKCGWCGPTRPPGQEDMISGNHTTPKHNGAHTSAEPLKKIGKKGTHMRAYNLEKVEFKLYRFSATQWHTTDHPPMTVFGVTAYGKIFNKIETRGEKAVPNRFRVDRMEMVPSPEEEMASVYKGQLHRALKKGLEKAVGLKVTPKNIIGLLEIE
tara:strand:+ start:395 stop:934 length:540 start_codon:yes stop_codon:yes gene_type:complete